MIGKVRVNVSRGLLHINMFTEMAIKKHIFDIKLTKRPFVGHNKREDNTDCSGLDDRAKSVNVVKTMYLCVALGNKTGFETSNRSVGQIFGSKHPFGTHTVSVGGSRNQNPGTIVLQGLNFVIAASQAGFLAADLNSLGSVDARRAERSQEEPTSPRWVGWRVLKMSALARVSIG